MQPVYSTPILSTRIHGNGASVWHATLVAITWTTSWCPVFKSSHCNSFEDRTLELIYGFTIFWWVARTWLYDRPSNRIVNTAMVIRPPGLSLLDCTHNRLAMGSFDNFFLFSLNKLLNKQQISCRLFEKPWRSCGVTEILSWLQDVVTTDTAYHSQR